jgi:hypothetical protein
MFFLIFTACTTAAMDDCQVYSVSQHLGERQCLVMADIYRDTLGDGPDKNYRLECVLEVGVE